MERSMRSALARSVPLTWLALIAIVVLRLIIWRHDLWPSPLTVLLATMAAVGTVCGQIQDRRDEEIARAARHLADVTRGPEPRQPTRAPLRRAQ